MGLSRFIRLFFVLFLAHLDQSWAANDAVLYLFKVGPWTSSLKKPTARSGQGPHYIAIVGDPAVEFDSQGKVRVFLGTKEEMNEYTGKVSHLLSGIMTVAEPVILVDNSEEIWLKESWHSPIHGEHFLVSSALLYVNEIEYRLTAEIENLPFLKRIDLNPRPPQGTCDDLFNE